MFYNNLKLLGNFVLFWCIPLTCTLFTSFSSVAQDILKKAVTYETEATPANLNILKLAQSDYKNETDLEGFFWAPFVLPVNNLTITNAYLYSGFFTRTQTSQTEQRSEKTFFPPPNEGECVTLNPNNENRTTQIQYRFVNTNKQKKLNTALFFIIDSEHNVIAVARLNSTGESLCQLNTQPFSVSLGYGRLRKEIKITDQSHTINLDFPSPSTLKINPTAENNIQNGDIIRIGRKINFNFSKKYKEFDSLIIPTKIYSDLYNHADMLSHDLSIDEYLRTSFLVGTSRYQIELERGQYNVAVIRKTKLICFNQFFLKTNSSYELSCKNTLQTKKTKDDIAYQFEFEDTVFDFGFRPESLIRDKSFVSWTVNTPGTILLGPPMSDAQSTQLINNKTDFFSLVFKAKGQILQTNYGASAEESVKIFKVPLIGMNMKNLLNGQTPFSEYILAKSQKYSIPYFLTHTNTMHTNGAEISILDPTMTNSGNLYATTDQKFFVRITIPKFNTTEILEMFINNKLAKRWILKRGNIAEPFSATQSINTYENKNFKVKFVARGESALSNFLTGRDNFLPFAETREFCVSIDGKENCL